MVYLRYHRMSKYVAPFMRKNKLEDVTLVESDFPEFVSTPVSPKASNTTDFKQTILNLIAKDQLDASERNRVPQQDPQMMTVKELNNAGWAVLNLKTPDLHLRFNESILRAYLTS